MIRYLDHWTTAAPGNRGILSLKRKWLTLNYAQRIKTHWTRNKVTSLSRSNKILYPPKQQGFPTLDPISARLVSPRLLFMQIRWLRRHYCTRGCGHNSAAATTSIGR
ncbi:hypothetical protein TNCV_46441 [Trichonephila clavipes]|nr:hypothetical protein TNCV_46441 [Trichonephila clavipes]